MKISIKKSNSTSSTIVVANGRIKVGEILNGKFTQTCPATKSVQSIINNFLAKNNI